MHARATLGALFKILIAPLDLGVEAFIPEPKPTLFAPWAGQRETPLSLILSFVFERSRLAVRMESRFSESVVQGDHLLVANTLPTSGKVQSPL